ncbi:M20 family metallopeptidase [uncultured Devosia sp.]|uniref:M20 family metallopeptidase n=1 Tax=uncultured Devosia sp. TaxID=211434 RepID=UPI0035CB558E
MHKDVARFVADQSPHLIALCANLVAAGSINPPGDVTGPAGVLQDWFATHGLPVEVFTAVDGKPNLIVTVYGGRPGPHLVFNGHLDTISPGDLANWSVPPLALTERDGRLYGLGIGNMKAGVAALAFATLWLAQHRDQWRGRLSFTAVADETVFGPDGAQALLAARPDLAGDALICAEGPGGMGLALAEKGVFWVRLVAEAAPAQGMINQAGENAIARLARLLLSVDALNARQASPPDDLAGVLAGAGHHELRLSANAGTVSGGRFVSQRAETAFAEVDFRLPPGLSIGAVEAELDRLTSAVPGTSWSRIKGWDANWTAPDAPVCLAVSRACAQVRGTAPRPVVRLPASDAARWRGLGVPAVCFGPQPLLVAGVDDYVERVDLLDCVAIYALAALDFLQPDTEGTKP